MGGIIKNPILIRMAAVAAMAGVGAFAGLGAVAATPLVLGAVGFTAAGVAAGSLAASMQGKLQINPNFNFRILKSESLTELYLIRFSDIRDSPEKFALCLHKLLSSRLSSG